MSSLAIAAQDVTQSPANIAMDQEQFKALANYVKAAANQTFNGVSLFSSNALTVSTDPAGSASGQVTMSAINILTGTTYAALYTADLSTAAT